MGNMTMDSASKNEIVEGFSDLILDYLDSKLDNLRNDAKSAKNTTLYLSAVQVANLVDVKNEIIKIREEFMEKTL
jgi:glycine cleavage system regulatory protein